MIQRILLVCLHHFIKICLISILPLVSNQKKFKLVYILNLESVTILLSKNNRKLTALIQNRSESDKESLSRDKEVNPKPLWEDFCFEAALRE